jgi:hypothetical protein
VVLTLVTQDCLVGLVAVQMVLGQLTLDLELLVKALTAEQALQVHGLVAVAVVQVP